MIYDEKFPTFIQACREAKEKGTKGVFIYHPEALGDTYAELIESLNHLSDAELALRIFPRKERKKP